MESQKSCETKNRLRALWKLLGSGGWQPMLAVHLCFLLGSMLILTPLTGVIIQSTVIFSGDEALSDTAIASFLLSPDGAIAGVFLASLMLTFALMGYAALLVPAHAIQCGERPTLASSFARIAVCAPGLMRLSMRIIMRYLLVAVPFILLIGATYLKLLSENDINYYLAEKPSEFWVAVSIAAVLLIVLGLILIKITVTWYYALPLILFSKKSSKQAKIQSEKATLGHRKVITYSLALWLFGTPAVSFLLTAPISYAANSLVPHLSDRLPLLALTLGGSFVVVTLISFACGFIALSMLAHQNIMMFEQHGLDASLSEAFTRKAERSDDSEQVSHHIFRIPIGEKVFLGGVIFVLLLTGGLCYQWMKHIDYNDDSLVIAHRGASIIAPENTMAAIKTAVEQGADWVEIDVQETADGKVVVFHDSDFKRLGGKSLSIWDVKSQQLPEIEIGSWFAPEFSKETTPSLREVLEVCKGKSGGAH